MLVALSSVAATSLSDIVCGFHVGLLHRDDAFRPEGPWKLSPGFNLGGRVLSSVRSEGPAEGEHVDGILNRGSSWHDNSSNPSICWRGLRVSHRSFRPGALLNGQPRLKPGLR